MGTKQIKMGIFFVCAVILFSCGVYGKSLGIVVFPNSAYYYSGEQYLPLDSQQGSKAMMESSRFLIPIRPVTEALGVHVEWKPATQEVYLKTLTEEVVLKIGSKSMVTPQGLKAIDVPAKIIGGRTYVPMRLPLEALGFHVRWHEALKMAEVVKNADGFLSNESLVGLKFPDIRALPRYEGFQLFTYDNVWNIPVDDLPVHPMSTEYIQTIGGSKPIHPDFGTFWEDRAIGFQINIVQANHPLVPVEFDYADESDAGPYPIPTEPKIEAGSDRHILILQHGKNLLYEIYGAQKNANGTWRAGSGAIWNLNANEKRPDRWTSADAAGLAIFPGLARYDEVYEKKEINHALRITLKDIQKAYIDPATHSGGESYDKSLPPMGLRMRLKANFDESAYSPDVQVIIRALKKYGVIVADVGSDMYISGLHDTRWNDEVIGQLKKLKTSDFEAVYTGEAKKY